MRGQISRPPSLAPLLAWLLLAVPLHLSAQTNDLSVDLIESRINAVRGAGEERGELLGVYEEAKALLDQAESYDREAANFSGSLTSAPVREAEILDRLDRLESSYDPIDEIVGLSPAELAARLVIARTEHRELTAQLDNLERRLGARETNASAIRARLSEIDRQLAAAPDGILDIDPAGPPSLREAMQWRNAAEILALAAEQRARNAQLASEPVRYSVMAAERAEIGLNLERLTGLIQELEARAPGTLATPAPVLEVEIEESSPAFALARSLAESDARVRSEQFAVNERLLELRGQTEAVSRQHRALNERFQTANRIVASASGSEVMGQVLLTYWSELQNREALAIQDRLAEEAAGVVIHRIGLEEELSMLASAAGYIDRRLTDNDLDPGSIAADTREHLLELARAYRERLRNMINAQSEHIDALRTLEWEQSSLLHLVGEYQRFLEEQLIWMPNHPPLWKMDPGALPGNAAYLLETARTVTLSVGWTSVLAFIAAMVLFGYRSRLAAVERHLGARVYQPEVDSVRNTIGALGVAALRAAPVPLLILGLAQTLDGETSEASQSLADLLLMTAPTVFFIGLMLVVTEPSGIGPVHFQWQPTTADRLHGELGFLLHWWVPISILAVAANRLTPQVGEEAIARVLMLIAVLVLAHRLVRNQAKEIRSTGAGWFASAANRFRVALVTILAALMLAILYGQVFLVTVVLTCVVDSIAAGVTLLLIYSLLIRWLRVAQARLYPAVAEASTPEAGTGAVETLDELDRIGGATRQLVNVSALAAALVVTAVIWEPLLPAFDALARVELWSSTEIVGGDPIVSQITLATLVTVIGLIGITIYGARRLPSLLEIIFLSRTNLSPGARYTISTLLNYLIIGTGIIVGLAALGLRWSQLQWLIAALGVGIGFGLQEIVANFISGLIILFERPIRIGDIVTVGDKDGIVTRIRIRATTIRDWDGKELLVPNKEFITGRLLNWTLSDPQTRLVIPVGIAYGSDVEKALEILRDIVTTHPRIVGDPEPLIVFENFGDNSLELSARCFIDSMEGRMVVLTELRTAIYRAFREAGIVIAFPQRDVHFDTNKPLHISIERDET